MKNEMEMRANEPWQTLRVGDKIRFVAMPTGFSLENCHRTTLAAYRYLIKNRRAVEVYKLDQLEMPWISYRRRWRNGKLHEYLLINHDGWVKVKKRAKKR